MGSSGLDLAYDNMKYNELIGYHFKLTSDSSLQKWVDILDEMDKEKYNDLVTSSIDGPEYFKGIMTLKQKYFIKLIYNGLQQ